MWAIFGSGGAIVILFALSIAFRHQVNLRTAELRNENEERRRAERNLYESRESFKSLVEFTAAIHWELDISTERFTYVSPQAVSMLGYPVDAWVGMDFWAGIIHPEDRDWAYEFYKVESMKGHDHEFTYRVLDSEGRTVWLRDIVKVINGVSGPEKLIGIMFDITGQKLAEEKIEASLNEKEILLKEIHHRVKNNMAVISSLSSLQSMHVKDEESKRTLKEGRNRIRAMALVHEQLYLSEDLSDINVDEYLRRLVDNVMHSYADRNNVVIKTESGELRLDIDLLVPCSLILNELLTNALKYAYEPSEAGEILVSLKPSEGKVCSLTVSDQGRGLPPEINLDEPETLGLRLVQALVNQLDGEMNIKSNGGLSVEIGFCSDACQEA
jgi:PAS domain S-box-containing protein